METVLSPLVRGRASGSELKKKHKETFKLIFVLITFSKNSLSLGFFTLSHTPIHFQTNDDGYARRRVRLHVGENTKPHNVCSDLFGSENREKVLSMTARARMKKEKLGSKLLRPPSIISPRLIPDKQIQENNDQQRESVHLYELFENDKMGEIINNQGNRNNTIPPFNSSSKKSRHAVSSKIPLLNYQLDLPHQPPSLIDLYASSSAFIDGVLPVGELFYRSKAFSSSAIDRNVFLDSTRRQDDSADNGERDDEELPFSIEQSDRLSAPGNKILIRRKRANGSLLLGDIVTRMGIGIGGHRSPSELVRKELTTMAEQEIEEQRQFDIWRRQQSMLTTANHTREAFCCANQGSNRSASSVGLKPLRKSSSKLGVAERSKGRKMVRRGMEMLVGGEPINADPPQRSIELNYYRKPPKLWPRAITTNSPDFGPLLHMHSAGKVEEGSIGLFCEHFVASAQKWGICPIDLKQVLSKHQPYSFAYDAGTEGINSHDITTSISDNDMNALIQTIQSSEVGCTHMTEQDRTGIDETNAFNSRRLNVPKGFGAQKQRKTNRNTSFGEHGTSDELFGPVHTVTGHSIEDSQTKGLTVGNSRIFTLGGELKFSLMVNRSEIEQNNGQVFSRVLRDGIGSSINADKLGFNVRIVRLIMVDVEGGSIDITVQFQLISRKAMGVVRAKQTAKEVNGALAVAMNDGKMAITLAHVAQEEKGWSENIRNRIVKEFLFETDDYYDENKHERSGAEAIGERNVYNFDNYDGPFGMEGDIIYAKDDIWLGGGNGGVFSDYSESSHFNSPYKGNLGPYLVDAAIERARQNQPRLIAIGDVHGCIDELKSLLKKCDYHPGDVVVFLGDLVCKGPDSLSVVRMAREIGAIGVRGNHDFEVVRWHQAIKSGADPPVIGSEHYYVACALNTADLKWMYSLPWFISSSHLNALFVHAGFVSGIRLAKQNPRLMMNMRSILPDGTVTSKFFNNWPWARLWDGPQTVFFGHDADRGLQQYEHAIGLDTGCVYGGKLTACILPERRLVSVNSKREYFQYRRKHFD